MHDSKLIARTLSFMSLLVLFSGCVLAIVKLDALWLLCFCAGFLAKLARVVRHAEICEASDDE